MRANVCACVCVRPGPEMPSGTLCAISHTGVKSTAWFDQQYGAENRKKGRKEDSVDWIFPYFADLFDRSIAPLRLFIFFLNKILENWFDERSQNNSVIADFFLFNNHITLSTAAITIGNCRQTDRHCWMDQRKRSKRNKSYWSSWSFSIVFVCNKYQVGRKVSCQYIIYHKSNEEKNREIFAKYQRNHTGRTAHRFEFIRLLCGVWLRCTIAISQCTNCSSIINYEHFHCWKAAVFIRSEFYLLLINELHYLFGRIRFEINKCGGNVAARAMTATASNSRDHKELINHQFINRFSSFLCACACA